VLNATAVNTKAVNAGIEEYRCTARIAGESYLKAEILGTYCRRVAA